jgi:isoleucyl-tRNA synthetase
MPVVGEVKGQYDPHRVEEKVKKFWEENQVYSKVKSWRQGRPRFWFIDGPPYPSSDVPHAGTAWNKVLKDAVLRYRRMRGYDVYDKPGYDCHGLPIEVAVEKKLGIRVKREIEERIGVERFIEECKKLVTANIAGLTRWFKELGVFMDWSNPYLTMTDDYIEAAWWLVKKAYEMGLLDLDYRVVYWCPRCSTTLAEYEVEYKEVEDPSIYVKFPVKDREREYLIVWTTTPWTLIANTFIMAHPEATYVRIRVGDEIYVLAEARLKHVVSEAGIEDYEVLERFKGAELNGLAYIHPLQDLIPLQQRLSKYHRVVLSREYVSLDEGSGLVHAAPGHGFEDFDVARRLGITDIAAPIDDEGRFTAEAGPYAGMPARDANIRIIDDLKRRNMLLHAGRIKHRYPVCWRCKTPTLLRATRQWVLRVTRLKDKLVKEAEKVSWLPSWALSRLRGILDNLQDWVLSRQRYWGTPLPIWRCSNCNYIVVVGSRKELVELGGEVPKELHRPWIDRVVLRCPRCGANMYRVPDVIDVWFDSGIAFYAAIAHPEKLKAKPKIDFITEGHDQIRGWFFSLLRAGVLGFNEAPYRVVLIHGFMLDEKGREMHKSLGNYVGTDDIVRKAGRDVFRLWVLQNTVWEDARFSWRSLEEVRSDLGVVWNVFVFASTYMKLDEFDPVRHRLADYLDALRPEDRWILSRLNRLVAEVTKAMDEYRVHEAARAIRRFIVEDVSRWYIRLIRRRVWVEEPTRDKLAAYTVLYEVLKTWLKLAAPFIPFLAEELYQLFVRPAEPNAPISIHLNDWPQPVTELIDDQLEKDMSYLREFYEAVAAARMSAGLKLRQPVARVLVYTDNDSVAEALTRLKDLAVLVANAHSVEIQPAGMVKKLLAYRVKPVYQRLGPRYRDKMAEIIDYLNSNASQVSRELDEKGKAVIVLADGTKVELTREDVIVEAEFVEGFAGRKTSWGYVVIDTRLSDKEVAEGLARDIIRRIQFMRKEMKLKVDEYIDVWMYVPEDHRRFVNTQLDYIRQEVRARKLVLVTTVSDVKGEYVRDWEISGAEYRIGISRASAG